MTPFEHIYRVLRYVDHPLYRQIYGRMQELLPVRTGEEKRPLVLDVGGRKSNYTVGLEAEVVITELPRETETQESLDLGATDQMIRSVMSRRSNIRRYVFDDLTSTSLPENEFDLAVAAEVIEHVDDDETFVKNLSQVLKPGAGAVLSTPNGDFVPNRNPDHRRHYKRDQLEALLARHFTEVEVSYAVLETPNFAQGLSRWSVGHPIRTLASFLGNFRAYRESSSPSVAGQPHGTLHLLAVVRN